MLNMRGFGEEWTDDRSPLRKEFGFSKSHCVIFKRSPPDREHVGIRAFDSSMDVDDLESIRPRDHLLGFLDGNFESTLLPWFNGDKGGLHDHAEHPIY